MIWVGGIGPCVDKKRNVHRLNAGRILETCDILSALVSGILCPGTKYTRLPVGLRSADTAVITLKGMRRTNKTQRRIK